MDQTQTQALLDLLNEACIDMDVEHLTVDELRELLSESLDTERREDSRDRFEEMRRAGAAVQRGRAAAGMEPNPKIAAREQMLDAHADGEHEDGPREGCPGCAQQYRGQTWTTTGQRIR